MSYDTQYHLTWDGNSPTIEDVAAKAAEILDETTPGTREHENNAGYWAGTLTGDNICKWYEHEVQMARLSREWPQTMLELSGKGEDDEDLWKKYFLNGRVHAVTAQVTYQPFNPELLREPRDLQ